MERTGKQTVEAAAPVKTMRTAWSAEGRLVISLSGDWVLQTGVQSAEDIERLIESEPAPRTIAFDTAGLRTWDSSLITFLLQTINVCEKAGVQIEQTGLPDGVGRLLALAASVPERLDIRRRPDGGSFVTKLGSAVLQNLNSCGRVLAFVGEAFLAFLRLFTGKARFRFSDMALVMENCGPRALPIISLISFLVGLILAFIGAIQLKQFGAQIYVANLVGIGMVREMGAMVTGIIMAGRTGAAFAAQLGTMTVNEEIDAFSTMGISPMEFLVLPRMLALILMMPLLTLYSDLLGILGGVFVGVVMLDIGTLQYLEQTRAAVHLPDLAAGLIKGGVYGVIVALAGCLRGLQSGRSASSVGLAVTSAVVTAIVFIVIASAVLTVVYDLFDF